MPPVLLWWVRCFIVTPASVSTVSGIRVYTANDPVDRDPVDFILEGSHDSGKAGFRRLLPEQG